MHDIYDILIAGAGPAGCAAAYDLACAGKRVLLFDKRAFPRPKACACGLTPKTLKALRYSVDPVIERVCREIILEQAIDPNSRRPRRTRVRTRTPICAMAVRERFDDFCLNQTLAAARNGGSVELRKIESILALRELPTHIELDIATSAGIETLRAPALIGADGSNGQTRHLARKSLPPSAQDSAQDGFALEATVPYADLPTTLPAGGSPHDVVFDFAPLRGGYGWLFPKADHINIGVGAFAPTKGPGAPSSPAASSPAKVGSNNASLKQVTRALLLHYAQQKLGVATLAHITGQHLGMGGHTYIPQGRILLVGDAAGLVDPLTGEGIHSAIVSGQAAAAAILSCADGEQHDNIAAAYARKLAPLQQTLAFSHRAARAFYAEPNRGFKAIRLPILRSLILKTYADGLPHTRLITTLAKLTT
jgi:geranylgeranyl reductase family protein